MLLIWGPIVMKGYLNKPAETARVVRDGWYETGDVAAIDEDGFIKITGRISRFSKIGGEMVPHAPVEEAIVRALKLNEEGTGVLVLGVPDDRKGERLVVLHTGLSQEPEAICRRLAEAGLRPISIPAPNHFHQVKEFPLLGTGKVDLRRAREIALAVFREG
jgi:acyl-[acyl-carrier-protein]-phospholipid O-acyltransferase/long-chain-fatty-acid--[acyl-carrier-protein] ligase